MTRTTCLRCSGPLTRPSWIICEGCVSFPDDWIGPGEYHCCYRCGRRWLPWGVYVCFQCRNRPSIDDHVCFCGQPAVMFFVCGARCEHHQWESGPDTYHRGKEVTVTLAQLRPGFPIKAIEGYWTHERFLAEREGIARIRQHMGMPPLGWLDKDRRWHYAGGHF